MARNLGGAIIDLLDSDRVDLRAAAATVLAAVGKGDKSVEAALTHRLADSDGMVRRIALEGLAGMGAGGIAAKLVPLLHSGDEVLAERAAQVLAQQGASAESTLRKEVGAGPISARRVMAQLLLRRCTQPAIEAVLDQLADPEFGEQALQLVRAELDQAASASTDPDPDRGPDRSPDRSRARSKARSNNRGPDRDKLASLVERSAVGRVGDASKALAKAWARAHKPVADASTATRGKRTTPKRASDKKAGMTSASANDATVGGTTVDPLRDPEVARGIAELGALLRLIGYLARPSTQSLLLKFSGAEHPRPIRLAAIAGLRRIVASSEARGTEKVIEVLIELADGDDLPVAQSAVDTLRGARIPDALAKRFAALARSKNLAAQKLAMERLPAGGGPAAVKALVQALAGDEPTARDAAARGLAKAPEAVLPVTRALLATTDEQIARRYAGVLRSHRGNVSGQALDELVERVRELADLHAKGKATADQLVIERVLAELLADLAPARHVELLFERARRLRKQGKSVEAFGSLKPLLRSRADIDTAITDDQRYFLALLALEAAGEGLLRQARNDDPVFAQFARLAARGYPVAKQLAREKDLADEALYALGFRLLESDDASNEELGAELLQGIIDERPRSKLAKSARNKLRLTGHLDA